MTNLSATSISNGAPDAPLPAVREPEDAAYRARVQKAAEQFESFFIAQMLRQMRSATKELAADDSVYASRTHTEMLDIADTAFADAMAGQRAFGIADVIVRQLMSATLTRASHDLSQGER